MTMTAAEFAKLAEVAETVARIEERQRAHELAHERDARRAAGFAPILSAGAAWVALGLTVVTLLLR